MVFKTMSLYNIVKILSVDREVQILRVLGYFSFRCFAVKMKMHRGLRSGHRIRGKTRSVFWSPNPIECALVWKP